MKLYSVICAVAVLTGGFNSVSKAGEIGFSFSPPALDRASGVVAKDEPKVAMVSMPSQTPKLMLALNPIPKLVNTGEPKLTLATPIPTTPSTNTLFLDGKTLELPEKTPFPNLHYVHRESRLGDGLESEDSFGRLWKLPKSELVFPYFKWENPTRKEERVLVGVFWSRRF